MNAELIRVAESVLAPRKCEDGRTHGDVGAAVLSANGRVFTGVCVDTCSWGLCAERSALAAMITAGEYRFQKIVAVWRDEKSGRLTVLPPCGICRQFMREIHPENLDSDVVLGMDTCETLRQLLPHNEWPQPL